MRLLFCSDPLAPREPASAYAAEAAAAEALGLAYSLVDFEALLDAGEPERAVRRVEPAAEPETGVFRGWMLPPEQYGRLYTALAGRGLRLVNDPDAYTHCHYLPRWYPLLAAHTPRSVWTEPGRDFPLDQLMALLAPFAGAPVVLKDYVKSRKHEWDEACYIPDSADAETVSRVVARFLALQGDDLNGGLVFREYVPFEPLTSHPRSGMPLVEEYRLFVLDGHVVYATEYWEVGEYAGAAPPVEQLTPLAADVRSRYFTMDVARRTDDEWLVVELGDGQVAGLPPHADYAAFYHALRRWGG
jgi:hypothetical protein